MCSNPRYSNEIGNMYNVHEPTGRLPQWSLAVWSKWTDWWKNVKEKSENGFGLARVRF